MACSPFNVMICNLKNESQKMYVNTSSAFNDALWIYLKNYPQNITDENDFSP